MDTLPSVLSYLTAGQASVAKFIKPQMGEELDFINPPNPEIMAGRILTLKPNMVVPIHVHTKKEKIYICQGPGIFTVFIDNLKYSMRMGKVLVIRANHPHAVACFSKDHCQVVVVSSSQDGADIAWEERADSLLQQTMHL